MSTLDLIFRILLGLNFFVFGLNGFFKWFAIPQAHERMEKFQKALIDTGYVMTVVKWIEVITGLFLLTGFFVPLAILICGPIVFMIVSAHFFFKSKARLWNFTECTVALSRTVVGSLVGFCSFFCSVVG